MARARLTSLDSSFLRVETPAAHMHVAWRGAFEPRPDRRPVTLTALRSAISGRLRHAERFRQRLAFPPGGLAEPVWVDDERFDIAHHVVALSSSRDRLSPRRFAELSEPLDRTRALWRVYLAPSLHGGGCGLVMKVHHAMVDGQSAVELALLLLDVRADAEPPEPDAWEPRPAPGAGRLALEALSERTTEPLRMAGRLGRIAARPTRGIRLADTMRRAALAVGEDVLTPAPASYVNAPIGPERILAGHAFAVERLLEVKRRHGATLNDVALAMVAGALRQLALTRRTMPAPLKVMVPVNTRAARGGGALGNKISFVFIELPAQLRSPLARLDAISEATRAFKQQRRASGAEAMVSALGALPPPLKDRAARMAASPRMYNLTVSNVPGPRVPVYLLGARLREAFPVIPLSERHALSVGLFTYCERACFGIYADPVALPEAARLPQLLNASLLELSRASAARATRAA